ncbi:MAG: hypothetical protein EHM55_22810, partial [Acidobacteria bacterium]
MGHLHGPVRAGPAPRVCGGSRARRQQGSRFTLMRRIPVFVVGFLTTVITAGAASAQSSPASGVEAFRNRCGTCHGAAMAGGTAASILAYVRYHTDAEVTAAIRDRHQNVPAMSLEDAELRQILAGMRELAGTNPAMATGGFTGRRGGGPGPQPGGGRGTGPARGAAPAASSVPAGIGESQPARVVTVDGKPRTGTLHAESDVSAVLLERGKFTLLSKDGAAFREKAIAPKADWTHYDGSLTGNRYSPLELINPTTVQRLGAAWVFPIPSNPRALQSTPVVQDGIMYVTGWNEIYALDATTGRQIWTYSEARHDGILSEGGIGTNRGVTIAGDKAFMVTD